MPAQPTALTVNDAVSTYTTTLTTESGRRYPYVTLLNRTLTPYNYNSQGKAPTWYFSNNPFTTSSLSPGGAMTVPPPNIIPPPDCNPYEQGICDPSRFTTKMAARNNVARQCDPQACTIGAEEVQLLYFPATTTASRNMCDTKNNSPDFSYCPGGVEISGGNPFDRKCSYPPHMNITTTTKDSGKFKSSMLVPHND
jgi:hypothetical protein